MELISFYQLHMPFFYLTVGIVSLFIGSFLNVVIYRLPRIMEQQWLSECRTYLGLQAESHHPALSLSLPFSHCPACKKTLRPWHNIPLLSYLWLRGHCAYCRAVISIRYPLVEVLTSLASIYIAWKFGLSWQTVAALLFTWISICLIFIDLDHYILPDSLTLLLLWLGLICSLFNLFINSHDAIIGAVIGYLIFFCVQWLFGKFTGKTGMGQGDFKFLAALGAFLGWIQLPMIILFASFAGILFALTHMIIKRQFKSVPLPFGPYLAIAGWVSLIWGNEILQFYLEKMLG